MNIKKNRCAINVVKYEYKGIHFFLAFAIMARILINRISINKPFYYAIKHNTVTIFDGLVREPKV